MSDLTPPPNDLSDPQVAARLGAELASDILREVGPTLVQLPLAARVCFFEAMLAILCGGMKATLGVPLATQSLAHVQDVLVEPESAPGVTLH